MEVVFSPLTGKPATLVDSIEASLVEELYKKEKLVTEDYFKGIDAVRVYKCNDTGFKFYYPPSMAGKADLYEQIQRMSPGYYPIKWEHYKSLGFIRPGDRVLDIGCGDGGFLKIVRDRKQGSIVEGLEFNELAIKKATANGIKVGTEFIESFSQSNKEQFDVVTSYQVLEHVVEVKSFIQSSLDCLKPGGKLIIGVPNNHPHLYKTDRLHTFNLPPHHMGLWSKESLAAIAPLFKMRLISCRTEPLMNTYYYTDYYLELHGLKKYRKLLFPIVQRFFKYTKYFRKGQAILVVYEK